MRRLLRRWPAAVVRRNRLDLSMRPWRVGGVVASLLSCGGGGGSNSSGGRRKHPARRSRSEGTRRSAGARESARKSFANSEDKDDADLDKGERTRSRRSASPSERTRWTRAGRPPDSSGTKVKTLQGGEGQAAPRSRHGRGRQGQRQTLSRRLVHGSIRRRSSERKEIPERQEEDDAGDIKELRPASRWSEDHCAEDPGPPGSCGPP